MLFWQIIDYFLTAAYHFQALDDKKKIIGIDDQGLTNLCQRWQNIAVGTYGSSFSLKVCLWCRWSVKMTPNITKLGTIASDSAALLNRERAAIAKEFFIYKRLFLKLMFTLEKAVQCRLYSRSLNSVVLHSENFFQTTLFKSYIIRTMQGFWEFLIWIVHIYLHSAI